MTRLGWSSYIQQPPSGISYIHCTRKWNLGGPSWSWWNKKSTYSTFSYQLSLLKVNFCFAHSKKPYFSQRKPGLMNNIFLLFYREYECSDLQSDLARDLSAQGGDGFSPSKSTSTPRSRLLNRRTANPDATQGHQPKQKRKYVPHLSWQYRAVIKSNVSVY